MIIWKKSSNHSICIKQKSSKCPVSSAMSVCLIYFVIIISNIGCTWRPEIVDQISLLEKIQTTRQKCVSWNSSICTEQKRDRCPVSSAMSGCLIYFAIMASNIGCIWRSKIVDQISLLEKIQTTRQKCVSWNSSICTEQKRDRCPVSSAMSGCLIYFAIMASNIGCIWRSKIVDQISLLEKSQTTRQKCVSWNSSICTEQKKSRCLVFLFIWFSFQHRLYMKIKNSKSN